MGGYVAHTDTTTAAAGLRALQNDLTQPRTRSAGTPGRSATTVHPAAPIDLGLLDHIERHAGEVRAWTREVAPAAGPAPREADELYAWMGEHTASLDEGIARVRDAMLHRHKLSHALAAGNEKVIRRESCPGCGCWGLVWRATTRRAVCPVRSCRDARGRPSSWTVQQLAESAVGRTTLRRAT